MKFVFKEFSILCDSLNLIGKEIVAIDGSKFRANNGRRKNYTKGKLEKQIKYYEENIQKYMDILDREDLKETDSKVIVSKSEVRKKIQEAKQRIKKLENIKEKVEKEGEISITDVDSKYMKFNNNGTDIAHNVQVSVDNKKHYKTSMQYKKIKDIITAINVKKKEITKTYWGLSKKLCKSDLLPIDNKVIILNFLFIEFYHMFFDYVNNFINVV